MTILLDGKKIAAEIAAELKPRVLALCDRGVVPCLAVLHFEASPKRDASLAYARNIERVSGKVGVACRLHTLPVNASIAGTQALLKDLDADAGVHGIVVGHPLPPHLDVDAVLESVAIEKDVDGVTHEDIGRMVTGDPRAFGPCTPRAIVQILRRGGIAVRGRHVVVLGRGATVGRPLSILLTQKGESGDATVTLCHSASGDTTEYTRHADIVVTAIGRARSLRKEHVKAGAVILDAGINVEIEAGKERIVGDADLPSLLHHASAITPVPGGVGPVTVMEILRAVVRSAESAARR